MTKTPAQIDMEKHEKYSLFASALPEIEKTNHSSQVSAVAVPVFTATEHEASTKNTVFGL